MYESKELITMLSLSSGVCALRIVGGKEEKKITLMNFIQASVQEAASSQFDHYRATLRIMSDTDCSEGLPIVSTDWPWALSGKPSRLN